MLSCESRCDVMIVITLSKMGKKAEGHGWEIIKCLPSVCPSVRSSHFCINLNMSFIYKDISSPNLQEVFMAITSSLCKI